MRIHRDMFRQTDTSMSPMAGEVENGVLVGTDGYLYLLDGGHKVFDYASGRVVPTVQSIDIFESNISARARICSQGKAGYLHLIVPDKQSVLSDNCTRPIANRLGAYYLDRIKTRDCVLYPREFLATLPFQAYYRTDTHLTNAASIHLAGLVAEKMTGLSFGADVAWLDASLKQEGPFSGDLGSRLTPPASEHAARCGARWKTLWLHNDCKVNNGTIDLRFSPDARCKKRVLIFGDSFGRDIAWFLSYLFSEVCFMRTPYFHQDIFDQIAPDYVLTENAERYLDHCMADESRFPFFFFPLQSPEPYKPSEQFIEAMSAVLSYPRTRYVKFISSLPK